MRKHKSVVAILLAVMMIFTFMPTMAFASVTQGPVKWDDNFTTATMGTKTLDVVKTFDSNTGLITAVAVDNGETIDSSAVYYYDFANATVVLGKTYDNSVYTADSPIGLNKKYATVVLTCPTGVTPTGASKTPAITDDFSKFGTWEIKHSTDTTLNNTESVTAVVKTAMESATAVDGKTQATAKAFNRTFADVDVTVRGKSSASKTNFYELDENGNKVDRTGDVTRNYDGKEHILKIDTVPGYDLTIWRFTAADGAYVKIDPSELKYKDVADVVKYKATYTPNSVDTVNSPIQDAELNLTVNPVQNRAVVSWVTGNPKPDVNPETGADYYLTEEQASNPMSFIEVTHATKNADDLAELKTVFEELYEVKVVENAADANKKTWTVMPKATGQAWTDMKAAAKKAHKVLFKNYTPSNQTMPISVSNVYTDTQTVSKSVVVTGSSEPVNDKIDDITFSGVTTKSFKAKKKTKKLAKAKTFQVVAKADSGNVITFSATSSNGKVSIDETGVVTVKKGLKKGAKVKLVVKAKTAAGNGYKAASAEKTYTIKIK